MFDNSHETGRAVMDMLTSGILTAHAGCKVIPSHAGGTLPYLNHRATGMLPHTLVAVGLLNEQLLQLAREHFWYDTAFSANANTFLALLAFASPDRIMFGSDFPNAPTPAVSRCNTEFDTMTAAFTPDVRNAMTWKTAATPLPRLGQAFTLSTMDGLEET